MAPTGPGPAPVRASPEVAELLGRLRSCPSVVTLAGGAVPEGEVLPGPVVLSVHPPRVLVALPAADGAWPGAAGAGSYTITMLRRESADPYAVGPARGDVGLALVEGAPDLVRAGAAEATLFCGVLERLATPSYLFLVGEVERAWSRPPEEGSTSRSGRAFPRQDEVHVRARRLVLDRVYPPGSALDPSDLVFDLGCTAEEADYALLALAADRLVRRDLHRGFVVAPLDAVRSDEALDAQSALQVGVVESCLSTADGEDLRAVRESFDRLADQVAAPHLDIDAYRRADADFHARVLLLARNPLLSDAFRSLRIQTVLTHSFGTTRAAARRAVDAQREVLRGLELRDVAVARAALVAYRELAKQRVRGILAQTGGRL